MKFNKNRSGCKDVFHAFLVKDAVYEGPFDIPVIEGTTEIPNRLVKFSKAMRTKDYNQWVHFYEDDYQFERIWNRPRKYIRRLKKYNGVILPDFSLYRDMPLAMQIWNIYRSRALGHWLEERGVKVIVNYRVGDKRTFDIACSGMPERKIISIGSVGCMDNIEDTKIIGDSAVYAINMLNPSVIIFYGAVPLNVREYCYNKGVQIIHFEGETSSFYKGKAVS